MKDDMLCTAESAKLHHSIEIVILTMSTRIVMSSMIQRSIIVLPSQITGADNLPLQSIPDRGHPFFSDQRMNFTFKLQSDINWKSFELKCDASPEGIEFVFGFLIWIDVCWSFPLLLTVFDMLLDLLLINDADWLLGVALAKKMIQR